MICLKCGQEMGDTTAHTCALITTYPPMPERRPWRCPVCDGTGKTTYPFAPAALYEMHEQEPCHACNGTGIVWG